MVKKRHNLKQGAKITSPEGTLTHLAVSGITIVTREGFRFPLRKQTTLEVRAANSPSRMFLNDGESAVIDGTRIEICGMTEKAVNIHYHLQDGYEVTAGSYNAKGKFQSL
tara:strand:+ start:488 stop:817 length:330 start_codon:yes stop_codon:yes gene_type:complete